MDNFNSVICNDFSLSKDTIHFTITHIFSAWRKDSTPVHHMQGRQQKKALRPSPRDWWHLQMMHHFFEQHGKKSEISVQKKPWLRLVIVLISCPLLFLPCKPLSFPEDYNCNIQIQCFANPSRNQALGNRKQDIKAHNILTACLDQINFR